MERARWQAAFRSFRIKTQVATIQCFSRTSGSFSGHIHTRKCSSHSLSTSSVRFSRSATTLATAVLKASLDRLAAVFRISSPICRRARPPISVRRSRASHKAQRTCRPMSHPMPLWAAWTERFVMVQYAFVWCDGRSQIDQQIWQTIVTKSAASCDCAAQIRTSRFTEYRLRSRITSEAVTKGFCCRR